MLNNDDLLKVLQEWANTEYTTLPYDRTEYELTVVIPNLLEGFTTRQLVEELLRRIGTEYEGAMAVAKVKYLK